MDAKRRVQAVLNRQKPDRIPVDIWCTPEILKMLMDHFAVSDEFALYQAMGIDKMVWINAIYREAAKDRTFWGSTLRYIDTGKVIYTEIAEPGLADMDEIQDLEDYPFWPDPDKFDYDVMTKAAVEASQCFVTLGPWISLFEVYCQMRGLEQALMDLVIKPDYVDMALDKIENAQTQMLKRFLDQSADYMDLVFISDDMGGQSNLLISLDMWDRYLRERMKRWCDLIHSYGINVFYHTDGASERLIPSLIDVGIDVLNPIQHICPGMDCRELKSKYGDKLIFHGGVDNQSVLPFGTTDDVRKETLHCLKTLGKGKSGYICCSCHNIQPGTPKDNICTMIDTVLTCQ